ncbi:MAG: hypothetical protein K0U34_00510, partial [Alphaproteobacteria bacterium]|nr:hypothetical protein [Alphaproteobacteria bacterium]
LLSQRLGVERTDLGSTDQAPLHQFWPEIARTETAPAKPIDAVSVGVDIGGLDDPAAVVALTRFNAPLLHDIEYGSVHLFGCCEWIARHVYREY